MGYKHYGNRSKGFSKKDFEFLIVWHDGPPFKSRMTSYIFLQRFALIPSKL
jgi:hypothetical protein